MAGNQRQKLKLLYIMRFLLRGADKNHGVTTQEIIDHLASLDVTAERKSVYHDIAALREYGIDVVKRKSGQDTRYHIGRRDFERPELALLVDAVQSAKFLTEKKSADLIKKLKSLGSEHEVEFLEKRVQVPGRVKMQNESVYRNIDALHRAAVTRKKVSFKYYDYDMNKKKIARRGGGLYETTPLGLAYVDEFYYLVTYNENSGDKILKFRVDRMAEIKILDVPSARVPREAQFDIAKYCQRLFGMFGGEDVSVALIIDKSLVNNVIDRFGSGVMIQRIDDSTARVSAVVTKSPAFFGWITQFGDAIKIDFPKSLAREYGEFLMKIAAMYQDI